VLNVDDHASFSHALTLFKEKRPVISDWPFPLAWRLGESLTSSIGM
jgi:hypothetical protein